MSYFSIPRLGCLKLLKSSDLSIILECLKIGECFVSEDDPFYSQIADLSDEIDVVLSVRKEIDSLQPFDNFDF